MTNDTNLIKEYFGNNIASLLVDAEDNDMRVISKVDERANNFFADLGGQSFNYSRNAAPCNIGGFWTNELVLASRLELNDMKEFTDWIASSVGSDIQPDNSFAIFTTRRTFDVSISNQAGRALFSYGDACIIGAFLPNLDSPERLELYIVDYLGIREIAKVSEPGEIKSPEHFDSVVLPWDARTRAFVDRVAAITGDEVNKDEMYLPIQEVLSDTQRVTDENAFPSRVVDLVPFELLSSEIQTTNVSTKSLMPPGGFIPRSATYCVTQPSGNTYYIPGIMPPETEISAPGSSGASPTYGVPGSFPMGFDCRGYSTRDSCVNCCDDRFVWVTASVVGFGTFLASGLTITGIGLFIVGAGIIATLIAAGIDRDNCKRKCQVAYRGPILLMPVT